MTAIWYRGWPVLTDASAWDADFRWYLEDEDPDWTLDPLTVEFVRDQHLRSPNGSAEDTYIEHLMKMSYWMAERRTERMLIPRNRTLVSAGFPASGTFLLPGPPLLDVSTVDYLDGDGVTTSLVGSPAQFFFEAPSGPRATRGRLTPLYGESWPATRGDMGSVRITYRGGYTTIPEEITAARLMIIGELYKQRSESVIGMNTSPAVVRAKDIFFGYRVF